MDGRSKVDVPRPSPLAARMAHRLVGIHPNRVRGDLAVRPGARHGLYGRRYRRPVGTVVRPRQPDAASGAAGKVVSPLVSPYAPNPAEPNFRFHVVVPLPPTGTPLPWGSRFFSSRA